MKAGRRDFLFSLLAGLAAPFALDALAFGQSSRTQQGPPRGTPQQTGQQASQIPRTLPEAQRAAGEASEPGPPPLKENTKEYLKENQRNMRRDVDHLLTLAQELKKQVDDTQTTDVLSLPLMHKAEEIEKLAHQIRSLARGN